MPGSDLGEIFEIYIKGTIIAIIIVSICLVVAASYVGYSIGKNSSKDVQHHEISNKPQ